MFWAVPPLGSTKDIARPKTRTATWRRCRSSALNRSPSSRLEASPPCGRARISLSVILTQANGHDVTQLLPLVDAIPPIRGKRGAPKRKPNLLQADRGYDSEPHRVALLARGIQSHIARPRTEHGSGLGKTRWVAGRTIAWLHWFRRLRIRYERLPSIHEAFL